MAEKEQTTYPVPLPDVMVERANEYLNLVGEAAERVYGTNNINAIHAFETGLIKLINESTKGLEGENSDAIEEKSPDSPKARPGRKPKLTVEAYQEAQREGRTRDDLEKDYTFSPQGIGAMKRHYGELAK